MFSSTSTAKIENNIILKVENEIITNYDIKNKILRTLILSGQEINQKNINFLKEQSLNDLIFQKLKKIELERFNFQDDRTQIDNYLRAISSNNISEFPEDSPELMKELSTDYNFTFPYCYDSTQEVAKNYQAACTPDFYIFDSSKALVYRGQLDDSRPENGIPVTGKDMRSALDAMTNQKVISRLQKPSIGCNIKWKS